MAARYRKYFKVCKPINCNGRQGKDCPSDRPVKENAEFKKCGVWVLGFFNDQRKWTEITYPDIRNRTEAERRLALIITDRERGNLNLPNKKKVPTISEYCEQYLKFLKESNSRENTYKARQRAIKALSKYLGSYCIDKLTVFMLEKYRIDRQKEDKVKAVSVNGDIGTLKMILNRAIRDKIISSNSCDSLRPLKEEGKRDRILTDDEIKLLIEMTKNKERLTVLISLFTGARLNEVLTLKWTDIDFENMIITIYQSKTDKIIDVPLSSFLVEELKEHKITVESKYLFEARAITSSLIATYSRRFSKLFKSLGIQNFTFHNLRHTFTSLQNSLGTDMTTTQHMLGHSSLSMTMRYSHPQMHSKREAIANITAHILSTVGTVEDQHRTKTYGLSTT